MVGGALSVVLFAALGGCGGSGPGDAGPEPTTAAPTTGTPAVEGTGAEEPAPDGGGEPALETVGLPIGGGGNGARDQCVLLIWSGDPVPVGVQVAVADVRVDGGVKSGVCDEKPLCDGYTFTNESTSTHRGCFVGVTIESGDATVSVRGSVTCSLPPAECEAFRDSLPSDATENTIPGPSPTPTMTPSGTPPTTESPPPGETDEPEPPVQSPDEPLPTG
jgi:hypothetical protein